MALKVTSMGRVKIDSEQKKGFSRYISRFLDPQRKNTQGKQATKDVAGCAGEQYPHKRVKKNYIKIECGDATEKDNKKSDSKTKSQKDNQTTNSAEKGQKKTKNSKSNNKDQEKDQENDSQLEEIIKKIKENESVLNEVTPEDSDFIEIEEAKLNDFYRQIAHLFDQEDFE